MNSPRFRSHGSGRFARSDLASCPDSVVLEEGVLIFHPENVFLGDDVYVGHGAQLKGYYKNQLRIGRGTWIGQASFLHAAGSITIGEDVGIGPHVCILTSHHVLPARTLGEGPAQLGEALVDPELPILRRPLAFAPVVLESGCDIGVGSIILPGVTIGRLAQVGAGSVVTHSVPARAIVAGNPARILRTY